ncbi:hypothetical protein [Exiguobacterium sp. s78]|uniref:hypothetical protein n=1 Tax=Exiguobacterium sp. s78 TaxID=2751197 RepID=UPI001BE68038|nr:hypothetical protein [Exiguobacterium sp. s78]
MKFLFSVIAAYVGIRAVVNSTKSAKLSAESVRIATESIRVTKEKDLREQSAHPIILSLIETFPYNAPLYKEKVQYKFPVKTIIEEVDDDDFIGQLNYESDKAYFEKDFKRHVKAFVSNLNSLKYERSSIANEIEIKNVGKGSCVNLNYEFIFENKYQFDDYNINPPKNNLIPPKNVPSYQMNVKKYKDFFEIVITDNHLANFMSSINVEWEDIEKNFIESSLKNNIIFPEKNIFTNYNFLESNGTCKVPIPNEFIILSKHYAIMNILRNQQKNKEMHNIVASSVSSIIEANLIKPVGIINLSFYDESLIRSGEYTSDKKNRLTYNVAVNENATILKGDEFVIYLEANLIEPEIKSKT